MSKGGPKLLEQKTNASLMARAWKAVLGLVIFTLGNYMTIQANIGLAPWDCFSIGLSGHVGLTYGQTGILVSLLVLAVDLLLKERIGLGTILDTLVCGISLDVFLWLGLVPLQSSFWSGGVIMVAGMVLMAIGQAIYMSAGLCCGPRDSLLMGLGRRLKKVPIGYVEIMILVTVLAAGWLLGGKVGIGTLLSALGLGVTMNIVFRILRFEPRNIQQEDLLTTLKQLKK